MKPLKIMIVLTASVLAASCTYFSTGIYEAEPVPGDSTLISVSTSLDTLSSIELTDSLMVSWEATVEQGELYYVEGILAEELLVYDLVPDYDPDTITGPFVSRDSFWLDVFVPVSAGIQPLELNFYYSTNSNSLGDYYRLEAWTLTKAFQINVGGTGQ